MNIKRSTLIILLLSLFVFVGTLAAADKPFRGELKLGSPNLLGFGAEYQLDMPMSGLAPYIDFSAFSLDLDETVTMGISYFGAGVKLYLDEYIGKPGYYAGLGIGRLGFKFEDSGYDDYYYDDNWDLVTISGKGEASFGLTMLQVKIGKRWNFGPITMALETGYGLGKLDDNFDLKVKYSDGSSETISESTADVPLGGGTIGAFSIGITF